MDFRRFLILFFILFNLGTCGKNDQFTTKLTASPFLAELYGETTKTIALSAEAGEHISWMGLEWSGDYKWFAIEQVSVSGQTMIPETEGSTAVFEDISVAPPPNLSGSAEAPTASVMMVKITYAPLQGLKEVDLPHRAYLLIAYDKPNTGVVRVELMGFVRGVCDEATGEECNFTDASSLEPVQYTLKNNQLTLFNCHPEISAVDGLPNDPDHAATRKDTITVEEPFILYVKGDKSSVHLVRNDAGGQEPSVPEFVIPVPEIPGVPPGFTLPAELADAQNVECPVDEGGGFNCEGVKLLAGGGSLVTLSEFVVSTETINPTSEACSSFGEMTGSGTINDNELTLVAFGVIEANALDKFINALVVAVLPLEKAE